MKSLCFPFFVISIFTYLHPFYAQKHDHIWLLGNGTYSDATHVNVINFNFSPPQISADTTINMTLSQTNICMADYDGNLLFYSNGWQIFNAQHQNMQNSEDFNDSPFNFSYEAENTGLDINQLLLALPPLNQQGNTYHIFHLIPQYLPVDGDGFHYDNLVCGFRLLYSTINMELDNGLGAMDIKAQLILQDTLAPGKITAVKHANGRDWWILIPKQGSNIFYRILLTPQGPQLLTPQQIGTINIFRYKSLGQAAFSPDGNFYAIDKIQSPEQNGFILKVFQFDRCSGLLSNETKITSLPFIDFGGGIAFSPNSRFLYQSNSSDLLQYDLLQNDISTSQKVVGVYDAFYDMYLSYFFYNAQLAPNGKIYINVSNGNHALHEINLPNFSGALCNLRQRQLQLPYSSFFSLPNNPNYRLGPIDESPCDTLGLNNIPMPDFFFQVDSFNTRFISFFDNSFYEPQQWSWDFGDGQTDSRINPVHLFPGAGNYQVCLTVTNDNGQNSACKNISIQ